MLNIIKITSILTFIGVSLGAPTSSSPSSTSFPLSSSTSSDRPASSSSSSTPSDGSDVTVTIRNNCSNNLKIYKLNNDGGNQESQDVSAGTSHKFQVNSDWSGRFWGCKDGGDCVSYGSAVSLAEFLFKGYEGVDFYDISFVDGFNLPMSIEPEDKPGNGFDCGAPACSSLPPCPDELKGKDGACKSACAAFGTEEYCCTGKYDSSDKCKANKYADKFKSSCSDAYSYAYDDAKSTFGCKTDKYTVTFCP
ncbi:thaumatin [Circinella umbellata]|nr:thaumatin [Circinella umbellata]